MKRSIVFILFISISHFLFSQDDNFLNAITTAVPFLTITPNAQEWGMAKIGVVSYNNHFEAGLYQNPALLSRNKKVFGIKVSYIHWSLFKDNLISDIGIYYSINEKNTIAGSFFYNKLGNITYSFPGGINFINYDPYEYFFSLKYAHSFTDHFSAGISVKSFLSSIAASSNPLQIEKLRSLAGDIGFDYRNEIRISDNKVIRYDIGISVLNLGPKVSYVESIYKDFIPTQLKTGTMWTYEKKLSGVKQLNYTIAYQAEKLLVPTPPIYENNVIILGKDPDVSALNGIFQSFYDAPYGLEEELNEILHKFGGEIMYKPSDDYSFMLRGGYFSEHGSKGNRKFGTTGIGVKYKFLYFDLAYIIDSRYSPLAKTIILSLGFQKSLN